MNNQRDPYREALSKSSDAIVLSRVLCIMTMSYVHLHFFEHQVLHSDAFEVVGAVLVDVLGRSSVPLLSAVSGFLMYGTLRKYGFGDTLKSKALSLVVPMLTWNILALVVTGTMPSGTWIERLNEVAAFTDASALIYLTFLRDLFALALLTPLLIWAISRFPVATMLMISVVYYVDLSSIIILRPQIMMFYAVGLFIAIHPGLLRMPGKGRQAEILAICGGVLALQALAVVYPAADAIVSDRRFDLLVRRPVVALSFWIIAVKLAKTALAGPLIGAGDAVFAFFLSHGLLFLVMGSALAKLGAMQHGASYVAAWLVTPPLAFLSVMVFRQVSRTGLHWVRFRSSGGGSAATTA